MNKYQMRRSAVGCAALAIVFIGCAMKMSNIRDNKDTAPTTTTTAMDYEVPTEAATNRVRTTPDGFPICHECGQTIHSPEVFLTSTEITLLAKLVEGEAGGESYDCKKAVASAVVNRMNLGNMELVDVITEDGQFDVASYIDTIIPSEDSINAVKDIAYYGITVPKYVTFFRADEYHTWGDQAEYMCIDNTYFSYSEAVKDEVCG